MEELNRKLSSVEDDYPEYDEESLDQFQVKVLKSYTIEPNDSGASDFPIEFIHIRSLSSTEEAIVPRVFEYKPSLAPLFQANQQYLDKIKVGTKFVFVTVIGAGANQSLTFFETSERVEVRQLS